MNVNFIDRPIVGLIISSICFICYLCYTYFHKGRANPELNSGILILLSGTGIQAGLKLIKFSYVDIPSMAILADFKPMAIHFAIGGVAVIWASVSTIYSCFVSSSKKTSNNP